MYDLGNPAFSKDCKVFSLNSPFSSNSFSAELKSKLTGLSASNLVSSLGVEMEGLIKDPQQIQAEQQAMQEQMIHILSFS